MKENIKVQGNIIMKKSHRMNDLKENIMKQKNTKDKARII